MASVAVHLGSGLPHPAWNFAISERVNFKINADFFNAWNHHQYAGDTGALIGSGTGGNAQIDIGVGDSTEGQITGTASSARIYPGERKVYLLTSHWLCS